MSIDNNHLKWRLQRSERDQDLGILQVRFDWLEHPRTKKILKRLVLESTDWINVVALTKANKSVMVEQYRFGTATCTLETAGGMVDKGESPLQAAQRELLEETGYGKGEWSSLGSVEPNPAFHSHHCHHFLARNVERIAEPQLGEGEAIEVRLCSLDDLREAMREHRLQHVLALSALSRVFELWKPVLSSK